MKCKKTADPIDNCIHCIFASLASPTSTILWCNKKVPHEDRGGFAGNRNLGTVCDDFRFDHNLSHILGDSQCPEEIQKILNNLDAAENHREIKVNHCQLDDRIEEKVKDLNSFGETINYFIDTFIGSDLPKDQQFNFITEFCELCKKYKERGKKL